MSTFYFFVFYFYCLQLYCPDGIFLPREIRIAFPRESQLRQSRATHLRCMQGVLVFP